MDKKNAKRFLKIIDKNIDKIEEEAIQAYKERYAGEITNAMKISVNLEQIVKTTIVLGYAEVLSDIFNEREIIVYEFNQEKNVLADALGELCYLKDYKEFEKWCDDEEENLSWDNYKKFNKDNFDELVERNMEDSLSDFLEELNESIENRKKELQEIVEN
ncbi:hypothetical protein Q3304_08550 [Clostridioides sp. GD02377]|uniref:hypothetical protein n=1 Tax=unclassified Clostridioides TaxID=2635829 RepID=UPI0038AD4DD8